MRWMTRRADLGFVNIWNWLVVMIQILNDGENRLWQGFYARLPGLGTPTALALIGQSRGLLRGIGETDDAFGRYLRGWLQLWQTAGSQLALCKAIQHYCGGVKVRSVTRVGKMLTLNADGSVIRQMVVWDWDSKSNPEKASHWSELWIIVYTPPWVIAPSYGTGRLIGEADARGIGHLVPRVDVDAIRSLLLEWKAARTRVNTIIFTYDATLFDPSNAAKMPDGWFGKWGKPDPADPTARIPSRFPSARYWHPHPYNHGDLTP
jgi:hypothetical protein